MTITVTGSAGADAPPLVLTLVEVAAQLRCTRRSVERQVAAGHLRVLRIGRCVRVERQELERFLESLRDADSR